MDEDGLLVAKIRIGDKIRRINSLIKNNGEGQVKDERLEESSRRKYYMIVLDEDNENKGAYGINGESDMSLIIANKEAVINKVCETSGNANTAKKVRTKHWGRVHRSGDGVWDSPRRKTGWWDQRKDNK